MTANTTRIPSIFSRCLAIVLLALLSTQAFAATFKSGSVAVQTSSGTVERRIYTEISRGPAKAPVVVLLNGLIYEINRWAPVANTLADQGLTVVRMSFSAQPESLRLMKDTETPSFMVRGLELPVLANDVKRVLDHYRIKQAVTIVGLSYGATVATEFAKTYPKQAKNLLLLSPLVVPLDNYDASSAPLRTMLDGIRFWESAPCLTYGWLNPWLCTSTDFWYDSFYNYFYENYLNMRVAKVPVGIEPSLYKKSVFQLVRAVRNYDLKTEAAALKNVHMVIADGDEAHLKADQLKAWNLVPTSERRSLATFTDVVHALPDEAPTATADWIQNVANESSDMQSGEEYIVKGE
jgi:pimeloyl-ACP methyl ester carboxylesterase